MRVREKASIAAHFLRARWRWQYLRGPALERYQERRARRLVACVRAHSPFYRTHWSACADADWRSLPVVDKSLMMASFASFNTRGITREEAMEIALRAERERDFSPRLGDLTVGLSSGTSGHRGLFLVSPREQAAWAGTILARALHTLPRGVLRVAFFLRSNSNLYEQVGSSLIHFRYFDLMLPLAEAIAALNDFHPHIVVGPPSLLGFLASARASGQLRIRPQRLLSVAEVLEQQEQEKIEAAFQVAVQQIYQCTEGLLAISCAHGSLHIQEDAVVLQFEPLATGAPPTQDVALTASERVMPKYNVMAVAKAALECSVRYLAYELGEHNIRVNAISAGALNTLAARGISGFTDFRAHSGQIAALRRNIEQNEVGDAALFLSSDLARAITGEILFVDAGYSIVGA